MMMDSSDSSEHETWIERFLSLEGNEYLCEVDIEYIQDNFNLYGLREKVPDFKRTLQGILDHHEYTASDSEDQEFVSARLLYGLVHARFIITKRGLDKMFKKYRAGDFGSCPNVTCHDTRVLPVGLHDTPDQSNMKLYCPSCSSVYQLPKNQRAASRLDGAFFGTTFPHLLVMQFPQYFSKMAKDVYVPRIFGFRVHNSQKTDQGGSAAAAASNRALARRSDRSDVQAELARVKKYLKVSRAENQKLQQQVKKYKKQAAQLHARAAAVGKAASMQAAPLQHAAAADPKRSYSGDSANRTKRSRHY